jgi:regulator of replication initiation timing
MNPPTIVFYEHDFEDSKIRSLAKGVLNLGNECRALSKENARLKAENERLTDAITSGNAIILDAQPQQ